MHETFCMMWFSNIRKNKAERELALAQRKHLEAEAQIKQWAEFLCIYAESEKKRHKTNDRAFSEDELRYALKDEASRFHAIIAVLMEKGRARKTTTPGVWLID